jgi:small-conductance mechanosensitive channel
VLLQHRILLHLLLQSCALIAFILICVILLDALVRHLVERPKLDRRRVQTLRIIFKLGIQVVGAMLILLIVFGAPSQMPTIVGLTTAGFTVAMQDFILAFFGWFILMGKNGIRVGDWVEINGVGGEVVDIGLFRTAMLETGNWTDSGHPTGRRVTFINNFAITGHYFNFSTTGQWMWDEISVSVPASDDTYALIELIHKAVLKETEADARLAEEEWKRATRKNGLSKFDASPAVDMRPGGSGIDIVVRYVTRAAGRFEVRNRLYQAVIGLLHKPRTTPPAAA